MSVIEVHDLVCKHCLYINNFPLPIVSNGYISQDAEPIIMYYLEDTQGCKKCSKDIYIYFHWDGVIVIEEEW